MDQKKAECFSVAFIDANTNVVTSLIALLRGICSSYKAIVQHEVVVKAPYLQGTRSVSLRLSRLLGTARNDIFPPKPPGSPPDKWTVTLEQHAMRGAAAERLPAVVREHVTPVGCWSDQSPSFWVAMGASIEYELVREGQVYFCTHEGFDIKVQVVRFWQTPDCRIDMSHFPNAMVDVVRGKYLVEVSTVVPFDMHDKGARAVAAFGQRLLPHVEMRKA